jgi:hypothetical protein
VKNGDRVNIELISSDEYDDDVVSTLTIGARIMTYRVTTMEEDTNNDDEDDNGIETNLSNTQKLQIVSIFLTIKDLYTDTTLRNQFLTTLLLALQDRIDSLDENDSEDQDKIDALQYLYDVIQNYLDDENVDIG